MKNFSMFLFVFALLYQSGCSSTSYKSEEHTFSFVHNDQEYSILSRSLITGRSVNYLLLREGGTFLLSARDDNLDGILDTMLVGDFPLAKANTVYTHGIAQAITEGKSRQLQPSRVYIQRTEEGFYAVQSYEQSPGKWDNRFVIHNAIDQSEIVFLDRHADGTLNQVAKGNGDLKTSQSIYNKILEEGTLAGQILRSNGAYLVELPQ